MATHRIPIFGFNTCPDATGEAWFEPFNILAVNDQWRNIILVLDDTANRHGVYGKFAVPQNYVDGANVVIVWTANAIAGDVEFDFDYRAVGGNDIESLDQAGVQQTVNANDTAPSAVFERMEITIALTDGNFAVGDTVEFLFVRDGTDGGDTMAAEAIVFGVFFEYDD